MEPRERSSSYEELMHAAMAGRMSRRLALKRAGVLGIGVSIGALLAACGGDDDDDAGETPSGGSTGGTTATAASGSGTAAATSAATTEATAAATTGSGTDSTPPATGSTGGIFVFVDGTEPNSLDPPLGTGPFQSVTQAMHETLLSVDEAMAPVPGLATDWEVNEVGDTWTFNIKQGVPFHDGGEFTSEAVKYTFDRLLDPDFGANRRAVFTSIVGVDASDPAVAVFSTDGIFPDLHFLLTDSNGAIVNPVVAEELGPEDYGLTPSGTGPFKFVEWVPNDHITMERFDDYHDGPATIDQVIFRPVPESSSREAMLRAGEAHVIFSPPPESVTTLQEQDGIEVTIYDSLTMVSWEPRMADPPFSDVRVRQALNYAVDKEAIISEIMNGLGTIPTSPAPPNVWGTIELEPYPYDPERAKELLEEAGYGDGFDGNFFYVSGRWAGDDQVAQATQSYWAQVGINIEIQQIDMGSLSPMLAAPAEERAGWIAGPIRTSTYIDYHLFRMFHSQATHEEASQRSFYSNPAVDAALERGRSTFDEAERLEAYAEAQRLIWEDAVFVWLFVRQDVLAVQSGVTGYRIQPNNILRYKDVQLPG